MKISATNLFLFVDKNLLKTESIYQNPESLFKSYGVAGSAKLSGP